MNYDDARAALVAHAGADIDDPRFETGFLGSLRPYRGHLLDENFREVMSAIEVISGELSGSPEVDRLLLRSLWTLTYLARTWALEPGSMLRRNPLISNADLAKLAGWVDAIEYRFFCALDGAAPESEEGLNHPLV